jgi:predicted NBD/HSP70 family sugar kinase
MKTLPSRGTSTNNMDTIIKPILDPNFAPSAIWNQAYQEKVAASAEPIEAALALVRPDETCSLYRIQTLPLTEENEAQTLRYLERLLKFLLWQRGASKVLISGCESLVANLSAIYSENGGRSFDYHFFGEKVYGQALEILPCMEADLPQANEKSIRMGYNLDGCRIGFDLGGSDRKCAAVIDGEVVFSEEVEWSPYFESNPNYHIDGINDTLKRAAAHLPRVDAIGGSAAGVYVNNEVRVGSLFRGVSPENFDAKVRRLFFDLKEEWQNVPFEVVNDGEVTALAGSMSMGENAVLGISMGTSLAAGYITPEGSITPWLNELAFVPVDYREDAPADEWSGDLGCGAQYLTQQAVARLAPLAGITLPSGMPFPEQLVEVQRLMAEGDERAAKIYSTMGTYLGYSIAHFSKFYSIKKILLLGRVTSGQGGSVIIEKAREVLDALFPELAKEIEIVTPNEKDKRHGQAVAAASLPSLT